MPHLRVAGGRRRVVGVSALNDKQKLNTDYAGEINWGTGAAKQWRAVTTVASIFFSIYYVIEVLHHELQPAVMVNAQSLTRKAFYRVFYKGFGGISRSLPLPYIP
jgi:hypothetical protein